MKITIKGTGKTKFLNIYDRNNTDWTRDLIGNVGGFSDGQFKYDSETDSYFASQSVYDWWEKYIIDNNRTESDIMLLAEELRIDEDIIRDRIADNTGNDYNDHRREAIFAMDEIRKEYDS